MPRDDVKDLPEPVLTVRVSRFIYDTVHATARRHDRKAADELRRILRAWALRQSDPQADTWNSASASAVASASRRSWSSRSRGRQRFCKRLPGSSPAVDVDKHPWAPSAKPTGGDTDQWSRRRQLFGSAPCERPRGRRRNAVVQSVRRLVRLQPRRAALLCRSRFPAARPLQTLPCAES